METNSFRAFLAIEVPNETKHALVTAIKPLRSNPALQLIKWTRPENLHITLRFLGNISQQQYQCIDQKISQAIKTMGGLHLTLTTLQPLPSTENLRVLTVKVEPYVALTTMALTLDHIVTTCGIPDEKRPFNPHLTLGRINNQRKINPNILHNV